MEVILLERILKLGNLGDKVKVKPGYARNYLIPGKKAVPVTADNVKAFERRRAELEGEQNAALANAQDRAIAIGALEITIASKAGTEGKLFGSVGPLEIAETVSAAGVELKKREVRLVGGPIRELGQHLVPIRLHADVETLVKVHVVAE
ncbi:MAG: 50S ribosomal protein L9 [Gammaproteobacteria bacterium]